MKISELKPKQNEVNVQGVVKEISEAREFQRFGKTGRVANALIEDDSGSITLTLWNDDIDMLSPGDRVRVVKGYVNQWQGNLQLTAGRKGTIEKLS